MGNLFCNLAFSCCTSTEQSVLFKDFGSNPKNVAECKPLVQKAFDQYVFTGLSAGVTAGRLKYDGAAAKACMDKMQGQCQALMQDAPLSGPGCEQVFKGLVANGGTCQADIECAVQGSLCAIAQNAQTGKCQPAPKEGEGCVNYMCAEGLMCGNVNNQPVCVKLHADGDTCTISFDCMSGNCSSGKCASAPRNLGDTCSFSIECNQSYCDQQTMKCTTPKADGAACAYPDECYSRQCDQQTMKCSPTVQCNGT
jgi:hypothetical protein